MDYDETEMVTNSRGKFWILLMIGAVVTILIFGATTIVRDIRERIIEEDVKFNEEFERCMSHTVFGSKNVSRKEVFARRTEYQQSRRECQEVAKLAVGENFL